MNIGIIISILKKCDPKISTNHRGICILNLAYQTNINNSDDQQTEENHQKEVMELLVWFLISVSTNVIHNMNHTFALQILSMDF